MLNLEKLNLSKQVVLDLTKKTGIEGQKSRVVLCIDYSGSMSNLYSRGFVQQVVERIIPIAMAFDNDQSIEVYGFHHGVQKLKDLTLSNLQGYVENEIMKKMSYGSTNYSPALRMVLSGYNQDTSNFVNATVQKSGFLGLGKKTVDVSTAIEPTYVLFVTDGENSDKPETKDLITKMSANGIFLQFVGLQTRFSDEFKFLTTIDTMANRVVDNANLLKISDTNMVNMTDSDLYGKLLNEYPQWVKEAKAKNIIK